MSQNKHQHEIKIGDNHAWFVENIPKYKVEIPQVKCATLYLSVFEEAPANLAPLLKDIQTLTPDDKINLIFSSRGGLASEGKAIINTVINTGATIHTELISEAFSMAAVMFCIGHRRVIYENSSLMFHNFSGGVSGKGQEMKDQLDYDIKSIAKFLSGYMIGLTPKEMKQMVKKNKEFWFGAKELCERGIATHVNVEGVTIPAAEYLKALKKSKKKGKELNIKISSIAHAKLNNIDVLSDIIDKQSESFEEVADNINSIIQSNELLIN